MTRFFRYAACRLLIVTAVCTLPAWSQIAVETPTQLLQRAVGVYGGRDALDRIADSVSEGTVTYFTKTGPQASFPITLLVRGGTQAQRIIRQPGGELREGTDGVRTWTSAPGGFVSSARGRALHFIESQTSRSRLRLLSYERESLVLRDAGLSGNSRILETEDGDGKKTSYFIDNTTSLITKLEFVTGYSPDIFRANTIARKDTYVFSNYRVVQGLPTPLKIERYVDGVKAEEIVLRSVQYNAALRNEAFRP
jgi:hypothetical protein